MNKVNVGAITRSDFNSDLHKYCALDNLTKVKELIESGADIYEFSDDGCKVIPLILAIHTKNEELIGLLMDVYEKDLSVLQSTEFKCAIAAYPEDQTEEFLRHCKKESSSPRDIPVLLKNDNKTSPTLVYLVRTLESKNDPSLRLLKKLKRKRARADINYNGVSGQKDDTFLHLAFHYRLIKVAYQLLSNPFIDASATNQLNQNPLHYAINADFSYAIHFLFALPAYKKWIDDPSYLYQAAVSGRRHLFSYMLGELLDFNVTLSDAIALRFPIHFDYQEEEAVEGNFMHLFATSGDPEFFLHPPGYSFTEEHYTAQTSNGMTLLHVIPLNSEMKTQQKIKIIKKLSETYPKMLMVRDNKQRLPLHIACYYDTHGHSLYRALYKRTKEVASDKDIFA
jgi:hypothetical protein